ncbi:MAG: flagellar hook assembly protein FlgD [Methylococcales bacterium]|nr:flagellar hook assembly protein FlgD [Methylococcales bacterium]
MAINSIETYQNIGLATSADKVADKKQELGQEEFLKLMTAQMTHQDPNKPMENGDFLAQMAQFSSVEGIGELNTSFKEFADSVTSGQALQASTLVGKSVMVPSGEGLMSLTDDLSGEAVLNGRTNNLKVSFLDFNGETVKTLEMGKQEQGNVAFNWDGKLDDGTYTDPGLYKIRAEANVDGTNTILETYVSAGVESVALGKSNEGVTLALAGLGNVDFNNVKKVF